MARIGAMIGEGARKDSSLLEMHVIINIAASAFLAYLAAMGLMSLGTLHDGILITLSGLLGYLGDQYSKGWLLKALKHYGKEEIRISEREALKEEKEQGDKEK